jgi:hypothetical protein
MTQSSDGHFTQCGLPDIGLVPFGLHACHFYRDREQLIAALAPYILAGLRGNELCLWITGPPLPANEAAQALRAISDGVDEALGSGALRIIEFDQWSAESSASSGQDMLRLWIEEEERALARGYAGLRIAGNLGFLQPGPWPALAACERDASTRLHGQRIVALCSYPLGQFNERDMSEIVQAHHCLLEQAATGWRVGEVPQGPEIAQANGDGKAGSPLYTFDCRRADDSSICLEAHELGGDEQAFALARKLLEQHLTCSTIEVFHGNRFVGAVCRPVRRERPSAGSDSAAAS